MPERNKMQRPLKIRSWNQERGEFDHYCFLEDPEYQIEIVLENAQRFGSEIEQFISLKDKNGEDIYEGDIIVYGFFALNDACKFGPEPWKNLPNDVKEDDISTEIERFEIKFDIDKLGYIKHFIENNPDVLGVEIIGNIHRNPELLAV